MHVISMISFECAVARKSKQVDAKEFEKVDKRIVPLLSKLMESSDSKLGSASSHKRKPEEAADEPDSKRFGGDFIAL